MPNEVFHLPESRLQWTNHVAHVCANCLWWFSTSCALRFGLWPKALKMLSYGVFSMSRGTRKKTLVHGRTANTWSNYCSPFHPIRNHPSQSQKLTHGQIIVQTFTLFETIPHKVKNMFWCRIPNVQGCLGTLPWGGQAPPWAVPKHLSRKRWQIFNWTWGTLLWFMLIQHLNLNDTLLNKQ